MEVTIKVYFSAFQRLAYHLFNSIALREELRTWVYILSVEVVA